MVKSVAREPATFSAAFCRMRPGDVLSHPDTGAPIASVAKVDHRSVQRAGKPTRYTVTLVLDEI